MYEIEIHKKIHKFIKNLNNSDLMWDKIRKLKDFKQNEILNLDIKKFNGLKKNQEIYRLRVGEIRIIFEVIEEEKLIILKTADYRGNVYN